MANVKHQKRKIGAVAATIAATILDATNIADQAPASGRPREEASEAAKRLLAASIELGRRITVARTLAGISQQAAREELGVTQPFLSDVERGRVLPSLPNLARLAKLYGVKVADLLPPDQLWETYNAREYLRIEAEGRRRRRQRKESQKSKKAVSTGGKQRGKRVAKK